ncbi:MAG: hypothetical protein GPOALKHO_000213 [Sodalis sp.]|nr:MAG: hypothetical protein GPOALKHO_000213 [Sodalis sp.]
MFLGDEELEQDIIALIKEDIASADAAVYTVIETRAKALEELDDAYLQERATDVRDIGKRLLRNILAMPIIDLSAISEEAVLVAVDFTPSETAQLNLDKVLASSPISVAEPPIDPLWRARWNYRRLLGRVTSSSKLPTAIT